MKKRLLIQWFLFIGFSLYYLANPIFLNKEINALSPLLFLATLGLGISSLLALFIGVCGILLTFWKHRFFCRYICPLGFIQNRCRLIFQKTFLPFPLLKPVPILGKILILMIMIGFWGGKSLSFLFLDPLILYSTLLSDNRVYIEASAIILLLIFLLIAVHPFFYCLTFCPCGAIQDIFYQIRILFCRPFEKKHNNHKNKGNPPFFNSKAGESSRRHFLLKWSGLILFSTLLYYFPQRFISSTFILPPGARKKSVFAARCSRCGRCIEICPTKVLQPISTIPVINLPKMDFATHFCQEDCHLCGQICPTGAIQPLTLPQKKSWKIAKVEFQLELCLLYYNQECSICRRECPQNAIKMVWSEEEYLNIPTIDAEKCNGCGRCSHFCPGELIEENQSSQAKPPRKALIMKYLDQQIES
ncbi:MAG: 4Fe-4S binding protein [Planctomycetia bacterium]|nr:4Fe-4S binding protein [Planctomycetia bacterium]